MARSKQFTSALNEPQCKSSAIQVIDRMVSLLDVLSQSSEPVSLKTLASQRDFIRRQLIGF